MRRPHVLTLLVSLLLGLTACTGEVDSVYSNYKAHFEFENVSGVTPLNSAVNNAGVFCRIWRTADYFYFQDGQGNLQPYPVMATDAYRVWEAIDGFIVGTTNIPDIGTGQLTLVAYDLACPNCYTESLIERRLDFDSEGTVHCGRCQRTYDLNNFGLASGNGGGRSLFRYRVYYSGNRLVVQN